jgi:hypothetical protein
MFLSEEVIRWLLKGDPSIRWQVLEGLSGGSKKEIVQERSLISTEGWGEKLLGLQDKSGTWSKGLYGPKWISTTYTLLLLRRMGLEPANTQAKKGCGILLEKGIFHDGGINYFPSLNHSETCVTGMILSLLSYFNYLDERRKHLVNFLLEQQMEDGGWNCQSFKGASHSSFHTTINILEGLREFTKISNYKGNEIFVAKKRAHEFLLIHKLFRSHRTNAIVDLRITRFAFPPRWHYDILRVLDYFQECQIDYDPRMHDALTIVLKKRRKNNTWLLQNRHPGKTFFEMEKIRQPSRWNTMRCLRVLKWFRVDDEITAYK